LWALISGRTRQVAVAGATGFSGLLVYALRVGESPLDTLRGYWSSLAVLYSGADAMTGRTSIRGFMTAAIGDPQTVDAVWIALSALVLAAAIWLAWRDRRRPLDAGGFAVPALFCLCSLAIVYHNVNNLILMLPAFLFLWFRDGRESTPRWFQIACLEAVLVGELATRLVGFVPPRTLAAFLTGHFDRVLVLACFVDVAVAWNRSTRVASGRPRA